MKKEDMLNFVFTWTCVDVGQFNDIFF